jgi:methionyl-tRNA synthetase
VIGKEILWFHAVIWPAMLMALELPLPGRVHAHSFWVAEGQKMSKSLGNFIDLGALDGYLASYGLDALRWYLLTQGPIGAQDADFRAEHFHEVYGTDLVNTVGNSCSRVTAMITKYFDGAIPSETPEGAAEPLRIADHDWPALTATAVEAAEAAMERFDPAAAAQEGLALVRRVDAFINETEPFRLAKDESRRDELAAILYQCVESLRIAAVLLEPVLVGKVPEFLVAIGEGDVAGTGADDAAGPSLAELGRWGRLAPGTAVTKVALYPRVEPAPAG